MKQIEGLAARGAGTGQPPAATCWRWRTCRSRTLQQEPPAAAYHAGEDPAHAAQLDLAAALCALACLFASVYVLLLRPVKKQLLAALRELPHRISAGAAPGAIAGGTASAAADLGRHSGPSRSGRRSLVEEDLRAEEPPGGKVNTRARGSSRLVQNWLREGGVE